MFNLVRAHPTGMAEETSELLWVVGFFSGRQHEGPGAARKCFRPILDNFFAQ